MLKVFSGYAFNLFTIFKFIKPGVSMLVNKLMGLDLNMAQSICNLCYFILVIIMLTLFLQNGFSRKLSANLIAYC